MEYQNRVVFFFDILGFRDLVDKEFKLDQTKSSRIYETFEFITKFYQDEIPDEYNPTKQITFFSDSVVISFVPDEPTTIFSTISNIQILLVNLAIKGIVMRGGISVGQLFHNNNYLYGPAFIEAYDIENKTAFFPRIICDDSIVILSITEKNKNAAIQDLKIFTHILRQDEDKYWYIDYIENIESLFDDGYEQIDYLIGLYIFIVQNLNESKEERVIKKYEWMKLKYNTVAQSILSNEKLKIQDIELYTYSRQIKIID